MSTKTIKTRIQLRRDLEENFAPIKDTFVPLKGEVVLIDTASDGLRSKVGDGTTTLGSLVYTDANLRDQITGIVVRGYYHNGKFYTDTTYKYTIVGYEHKIYIDLGSDTRKIYGYNEASKSYGELSGMGQATSSSAGIMYLYDEMGTNTNGTMTQNSISTEIGKKFEVTAGTDETLIFTK